MRNTLLLLSLLLVVSQTAHSRSEVLEYVIHSKSLASNILGIDPARKVLVYLPPSYNQNNRPYPVIYFFHNNNWSNVQTFQEDNGNNFKGLLDEQIALGAFPEAIVVAGDFTAPTFGAFYENNATSGRWLDHIRNELIPWADNEFRTLANRNSRAAIGDFFGGYAVLKLAMYYPELFSVVYSMHPVATSTGETRMISRPDWRVMNTAKTWEELDTNPYSRVFMRMAQSYLPNPNKPPFYADLMVELKNDKLVINSKHVHKLRSHFLLDEQIPLYAENLRKLSALKIDWGRFDENPDHVYANQKFVRLLLDYGVEHEAEEYNGNAWNQYWIENGRVKTEVLPFIKQHLVFE